MTYILKYATKKKYILEERVQTTPPPHTHTRE